MYNVIFGENKLKDILFKILNKKESDFGRFRDIYIDEEKKCIGVYTRNGGGNRKDYEEVFEEMKKHPLYLYNEDDDFDCTYATIYFKLPEEYKELLNYGEKNKNSQWLELIEKIGK